MRHLKTLLCCGIATILFSSGYAQGILNKMKKVGNNVADKVINKKIDEAVNGQGNPNGTGQPGTPGTPEQITHPTMVGRVSFLLRLM
jgi:hypothetical protein